MIRNIANAGRVTGLPKLLSHQQVVTDFEFYPFDEQLFASTSMDSVLKIWKLPLDGELSENFEPVSQMYLNKVCNRIYFHPSVSNTMVTAHSKNRLTYSHGR
jgi:WD40 repeat protein